MSTDDFFRARLDQMIDLRHPLAVLATRMPWDEIGKALAPAFAHKDRAGHRVEGADLFGPTLQVAGSGVSNRGRPRLPIRSMVALLYLKHAFNLSDEELVERWSENVVWQFFSGMAYYTPKLPCDATQIGRFRRVLGEAGVEQLLKSTIEAAVAMKAVGKREFERVIVDSTVQEKAIAHPADSRLLEVAREKIVRLAKRAGIALKLTHEREGKTLRRRAAGYAHAKQFKRLKRVLRRQRTILGSLLREVRRKMTALPKTAQDTLTVWLERAERLHAQRPHDKGKLYALHAPEVECIGKGKARQPYEFGVKVSVAVTHRQGLMVGARSFPGNPYDGHTLAAQLEQTNTLLQDIGVELTTAVVDLGYRGVDADIAPVQLVHRGKSKTLTARQRAWLRRRQAVEPAIGHLKADHRMDRCWLKGSEGDALHAVLCAAGFNIRWLLRAIARLGLAGVYCALALLTFVVRRVTAAMAMPLGAPSPSTLRRRWELRRCRQLKFAGPTAEYRAAGVPAERAESIATGVLKTGDALPVVRTVSANEELIKVVPKNVAGNDGVGAFSPYFMTRSEYDALSKLSPSEIGQRLGLPAEQSVRGAQLGFDAFAITPKPGTAPKVFTSTVAPVEQGVYKAVGGHNKPSSPTVRCGLSQSRLARLEAANELA